MTMIKYAVFGTVLLSCSLLRGSDGDLLDLSIAQTVNAPEQRSSGISVVNPIKCSPDGELFSEFLGGESNPAVALISADRQHVSWFDITQIQDLEGATLVDFAPGPSHDLILLVTKQPKGNSPAEYYIAFLKADRSMTIKRLATQPQFFPRQIAMLGQSSLLISGFAGLQQQVRPLIQIFSMSGDFVKTLSATEDSAPATSKSGRKVSGTESSEGLDFRSTLEISTLQTADDGSVYVTRPTPTGPVLIISPGGEIRAVRLRSPDQRAQLASVKINEGTIVAEYSIPRAAREGAQRNKFLVLTNLLTQQTEKIIGYRAGQQTGVGLACFRERTFEFLTQAPDGHLQFSRSIAY